MSCPTPTEARGLLASYERVLALVDLTVKVGSRPSLRRDLLPYLLGE
jgi:hypothetical protein